ncbi:hypothetical protein [Amycolatopsis sp. H20-H5]|uniref:hypothetical protein n=1 Tax=Amycolatopsis sp. H20-H5 TaxID=3046309 RepID=UPI002DB645BC|nr:hypothetical protein [Amycolatopsis sp. H20-H5]MEC3982389.1 hypothetical protein [Amycolatopsis sp. H20-H5]
MPPEELLRDFRQLFTAQTKSLRALATASHVGVETIRGWKDENRFPKSGEDFLEVVRTCLKFPKEGAPAPPWRLEEWAIRYREAKWLRDNEADDRRPSKPVPILPGRQEPSVQVYDGDYVVGSKNSVHIGDVNHHLGPQ